MNVVLAGRYELDQRLGRGGMAEVWRGRDLVLGRRIAVKTVSVADATDLTLGDRLRREAVATAALDHPDIVTVHDAGVDGETAFLVMELATGQTLAALLAEGPLPLAEAVRIGARVTGALAAAHAAGIVHRDIKPANIMVDGERITVVDFGIAAIEFQAVTSLTAPGTTLGTAEYMAPEQARAEPATSGTDMYSVGCLLTTMIAGRPPFTAESAVAILHHHAYIQPPRLRSLRPDVPDELDALVGALLDKDADARPTAVETYEWLVRIAEALLAPAPVRPPSGGAGPASPAAASTAVPPVPVAKFSPPTAAGPALSAAAQTREPRTGTTTRLDGVRTATLAGVAASAREPQRRARTRHVPRPHRRRVLVGTLAAALAGIGVSATVTGFAPAEPVGKQLVANSAKVTVVGPAVAGEIEAPLATAVPALPATDEPAHRVADEQHAPADEAPPVAATRQEQGGVNANAVENNGNGNGNIGKGQVSPPGRGNGANGNGNG
ncbi:serine/threonine-protein kinase [Georgenia soli]|uniref:non-specific serine/threonine protein kinase n=1 Tax=Georgenia soli TaxID=638953 RepID=A0A2A9EL58_9MICO|nr:serine/threonine-protein kinase [Georgenia soli]PFG38949.1 serine/threonine-protein kinase [Georgenia soli]